MRGYEMLPPHRVWIIKSLDKANFKIHIYSYVLAKSSGCILCVFEHSFWFIIYYLFLPNWDDMKLYLIMWPLLMLLLILYNIVSCVDWNSSNRSKTMTRLSVTEVSVTLKVSLSSFRTSSTNQRRKKTYVVTALITYCNSMFQFSQFYGYNL